MERLSDNIQPYDYCPFCGSMFIVIEMDTQRGHEVATCQDCKKRFAVLELESE